MSGGCGEGVRGGERIHNCVVIWTRSWSGGRGAHLLLGFGELLGWCSPRMQEGQAQVRCPSCPFPAQRRRATAAAPQALPHPPVTCAAPPHSNLSNAGAPLQQHLKPSLTHQSPVLPLLTLICPTQARHCSSVSSPPTSTCAAPPPLL